MNEQVSYEIEHTAITVDNLEESIEWYNTNFGFQEMRRFDKPSLTLRGATMKLGSSLLEILSPYSGTRKAEQEEGKEDLRELLKVRGLNHIALSVNDINESYNRLRKNNVELVTEVLDSKYFFCKDSNGILIEVKKKV